MTNTRIVKVWLKVLSCRQSKRFSHLIGSLISTPQMNGVPHSLPLRDTQIEVESNPGFRLT
jgi:hypothetical protein